MIQYKYGIEGVIRMKKCQFCNKEFEPNKNGARYKYCSEECYKEERRKRKRERWRRQNPDWNKKVIKKCEWCGDEYSVPKRNAHQARFCSSKCRHNYRRVTRGQNRERRIKRNPDLNKEVIKKCEWCGGEYIVLKRNAHQAKFCSDNCRNTYHSRVVKGHKSWEEHAKKRKIRTLIRLIKDEINRRENLITKTCSECGKDFYTTIKQRKTCSKECSRKRKNRRNWERKLERMNNAVIDRDISLDRLYSRDKGICYICGGKCDFKDYVERNGHFIAGPKYPSIDHVIPLSKGGKHSWENVKLAHHRCNTLKSNRITHKERTLANS